MIWMAVTADEYELPLSMAESCWELGRKMHIDGSTVHYLAKNNNTSRYPFNNYYYRIVRIEEDD